MGVEQAYYDLRAGLSKGFTMDCIGFPIHKPIRLLMVTCGLCNAVQQMVLTKLLVSEFWKGCWEQSGEQSGSKLSLPSLKVLIIRSLIFSERFFHDLANVELGTSKVKEGSSATQGAISPSDSRLPGSCEQGTYLGSHEVFFLKIGLEFGKSLGAVFMSLLSIEP